MQNISHVTDPSLVCTDFTSVRWPEIRGHSQSPIGPVADIVAIYHARTQGLARAHVVPKQQWHLDIDRREGEMEDRQEWQPVRESWRLGGVQVRLGPSATLGSASMPAGLQDG